VGDVCVYIGPSQISSAGKTLCFVLFAVQQLFAVRWLGVVFCVLCYDYFFCTRPRAIYVGAWQ